VRRGVNTRSRKKGKAESHGVSDCGRGEGGITLFLGRETFVYGVQKERGKVKKSCSGVVRVGGD